MTALLNPTMSLVLAAAFLTLWLYLRERQYLAVFALAYVGSALGFLFQHFTLPVGLPVSKLVSNASFLIAGCFVVSGIMMRYDRKIPYVALCMLTSGGLSAFCWFMFVQPDLTWRIYVMNFVFGGMALLVAVELRRVPDKVPVDKVLMGITLLSALNFFVRTIVLVKMHGPYAGYDGFYGSLYWTTLQLSHILLSLGVALTLIALVAVEVTKELRTQSHTDPLSGLLNRRGFEERAQALLRGQRNGVPIGLVLADLDHFKRVNDTYGHATGDAVIAAFARHLRVTGGHGAIVGRIGGEEFAVLLPATDLSAARLFAEGVRVSFSQTGISGLPTSAKRISASFGVAEFSSGESLDILLGRADDALYQAKKNGRDSVRFSYVRPEMPYVSSITPEPAVRS